MCPDDDLLIENIDKPLYLTTPSFTEPGGTYESDSLCRCTAMATDGAAMHVRVLYYDIEATSNGSDYCDYDWLEFSSNGKWNSQPSLS